MENATTLPRHRRTLVRACVAALLAGLIGAGACTTGAPSVPPSTGELPTPSPVMVGVADTPAPTGLTAPTAPTAPPTPDPTASPSPTPSFSLGPLPTEPGDLGPSGGPYPLPTQALPTQPSDDPGPGPNDPLATSTPAPPQGAWNGKPGKPATRIVISGLRIDLPVISGNSRYPKCDVAQYMPSPFVNPGVVGPTYIYGHAQRRMLLPMLEASKRNNGAEMIGMRIDVYTSANARYVYEIFRVKRHATDFSLAFNLKAGEHRLVVQTSEGPSAAYPKLQVAARLLKVYAATKAQAQPLARPRTCG